MGGLSGTGHPGRTLLASACALAIVLLAARGVWRPFALRRAAQARLAPARRAFDTQRFARVWELFPDEVERDCLESGERETWNVLGIRTAAATRDGARLLKLRDRCESLVQADEEASYFTARALAACRDPGAARELSRLWSGRGAHPEWWLALDADVLMLTGDAAGARKRLERARLPGKLDAARLCRLALVRAKDGPEIAWPLLEAAVHVDPARADVRVVRAELLEAAGRLAEAQDELRAAVGANPADPWCVDQLAELHVRSGNLRRALIVWDAAPAPAPDWLSDKRAFWAAVVLGRDDGRTAPAGTPAATWRAVLDAFSARRFEVARDALRTDRGQARAMSPHLFGALELIAARRCTPRGAPAFRYYDGGAGPAPHSFFAALAELTGPASAERAALERLLDADEAPALACLCAAWQGAGLALWPAHVKPDELPEWARFVAAESLRRAGRPERALDLLPPPGKTPLLDLSRAECLAASGRPAAALLELQRLAQGTDPIARRARVLVEACRRPDGAARVRL